MELRISSFLAAKPCLLETAIEGFFWPLVKDTLNLLKADSLASEVGLADFIFFEVVFNLLKADSQMEPEIEP